MNLMKKVSIIIICLTIFSFCFCGTVRAEVDWMGKLTEPIVDLSLFVGDAITSIVHRAIFDNWTSLIRIDLTWTAGEIAGAIAGGILAIAGVAVILVIPGIREAAIAAAATTAGGLVAGAAAAAGAMVVGGVVAGAGAVVLWNSFPDDRLALPQYSISAEEIFSNEIALFDVDFFNPMGHKNAKGEWVQDYKVHDDDDDTKDQVVEVSATAAQLQSIIATWYKRLRDISIVASMSILVYIGIRILLSSTSNDKAKYKQMIMDWVIALCLLFVMQYIMSFSNIIVDKITELVKTAREKTMYTEVLPYDDKILESINEAFAAKGYAAWTEDTLGVFSGSDGKKYFYWTTNMMGNMRLGAQQELGESADGIGYAICFITLVFFTVFFVFTYIKRVLYMAFLTIVAPLVALTYPIDKINDGKAQAFNTWLKEYIFNLLVQPMHLLLYIILISSALDLATKNIIYSIVAIGFMMPAEKLMRKFFGFEKAQTPGMLNGAAGAAMVMSGMNKLLSKGGKGSGGGSGKHGGSDSEKDNTKINMHENFDAEEKFGAPKQEETPLRIERPTPEEDNNRFNTNNNPPVNDKPPANDNPPGMYMSDSGLYVPDSYKNTPKTTGDNEKPKNPAGEPEKPEEEKDYIEDRIMNSLRGSRPYQAASRAKNAVVTAGGNARRAIGTKLGNAKTSLGNTRVIKGIKNLPNKSKIIDKGVNTSKKLAKTGSRAARFYAQGMANKISDKVKNGHLGRKAIKFAGGAALGTAAAMVAAGAGLASGDPTKMAQYVGAAAAGGYVVGSSGVDKTADAIKVEGTKDVINETYHGKQEMKRREQIKEARQKQKDLQLRWKLEEKLGSKEAAKRYMQEELPEIVKYGDFDNKTIVAMAQMKEKDGMSRDETIAAALMSEEYLDGKDINRISGKTAEEFDKTLNKRAKERSLEGERLKEFKDRSTKAIKKLDKYRYD